MKKLERIVAVLLAFVGSSLLVQPVRGSPRPTAPTPSTPSVEVPDQSITMDVAIGYRDSSNIPVTSIGDFSDGVSPRIWNVVAVEQGFSHIIKLSVIMGDKPAVFAWIAWKEKMGPVQGAAGVLVIKNGERFTRIESLAEGIYGFRFMPSGEVRAITVNEALGRLAEMGIEITLVDKKP